jgi:hypothetical protein
MDIKELERAVTKAEYDLKSAQAMEKALTHRIEVLEPERMRTLVTMLAAYKDDTARAHVALGRIRAELLQAKGKEQ